MTRFSKTAIILSAVFFIAGTQAQPASAQTAGVQVAQIAPAAQGKTPSWIQVQKQGFDLALLQKSYNSLASDIAKLQQDIATRTQELAEKQQQLQLMAAQLERAKATQSAMQNQRIATAQAKKDAKEAARVAAINQKAEAKQQKAAQQLAAKQLQSYISVMKASYDAKVERELKGVKNLIKRQQAKSRFNATVKELQQQNLTPQDLLSQLSITFGVPVPTAQ